ncbi:CBS domain-containing protein [Reyranella sp.]|uniref:CBS domain-containing protein n=1 Tax=Reyranella sp. TaxID=1929291 RepID=UPI003D0A8936
MRKLGPVTLEHSPIILNQTASVAEACNRMRDGRAGSVLVTDNSGMLVGIFTGRDAVCRVLAHGREAATTPLADVMTANPTSMSPDQTTVDALRLMRDGGFRHLPLVRNHRIVGLLSRSDYHDVGQRSHEEERDPWEHWR